MERSRMLTSRIVAAYALKSSEVTKKWEKHLAITCSIINVSKNGSRQRFSIPTVPTAEQILKHEFYKNNHIISQA